MGNDKHSNMNYKLGLTVLSSQDATFAPLTRLGFDEMVVFEGLLIRKGKAGYGSGTNVITATGVRSISLSLIQYSRPLLQHWDQFG